MFYAPWDGDSYNSKKVVERIAAVVLLNTQLEKRSKTNMDFSFFAKPDMSVDFQIRQCFGTWQVHRVSKKTATQFIKLANIFAF